MFQCFKLVQCFDFVHTIKSVFGQCWHYVGLYLVLDDFSIKKTFFIGISSTTCNLLAYNQSCQTDFPKVVGVDKACQTNFSDTTFFRSLNSEITTTSAELSDLIGSSTTTNEPTDNSGDYELEGSYESEEESDCSELSDEDEPSDSFDDESYENDDVDEKEKEDRRLMCDLTISLMEKQLQHYTGINKESSYVVDVIIEKTGISKRNVLLVLRKIRHNESFRILGDVFGVTRVQAGRIFSTNVKKMAEVLKPFIYWPDPTYIKYNLPLQFKHKFRNVQIIIDCFEISVRKPKKVIDHALTWSSYKHSNTVKYLIGATPDGLIIFISKGFSGRITDTEIIKRSGFLNFIKKNMEVMADRGFKDIAPDVMSKGGILIKPPSTKAGTIYTVEEAKMCKIVAATRIHIERVIGRVRNFAFLKPQHSLLDSKRVYLLEYAVIIGSAICNMHGLLTKI